MGVELLEGVAFPEEVNRYWCGGGDVYVPGSLPVFSFSLCILTSV